MVRDQKTKRARRILVCRVIDGDSLSVKYGGFWSFLRSPFEVRLYAIDAPEAKQPHGKEAAQYLRSIIPGALVMEDMGLDRYGRTVGLVYGKRGREGSVNLRMVQAGMALWYRRYGGGDLGLAEAEAGAKARKLGVWTQGEKQQLPWDYRTEMRNRGKTSWLQIAMVISVAAGVGLGLFVLNRVFGIGAPFPIPWPLN